MQPVTKLAFPTAETCIATFGGPVVTKGSPVLKTRDLPDRSVPGPHHSNRGPQAADPPFAPEP